MSVSTGNPLIYQFLPYFGAFPNYFQLYLDSVGINTDILRIILITDIDLTQYRLPTNVLPFAMTLDEVRGRAS